MGLADSFLWNLEHWILKGNAYSLPDSVEAKGEARIRVWGE